MPDCSTPSRGKSRLRGATKYRPDTSRGYPEFLIANGILECPLTHSKQSTATRSNREKYEIIQLACSGRVHLPSPQDNGAATANFVLSSSVCCWPFALENLHDVRTLRGMETNEGFL